jgi:hypothetical protein
VTENVDTADDGQADPLLAILGANPTAALPVCEVHDMHLVPKCSTCVERALQEARYEARASANRAHEVWKDESAEAARRWADENNLCSSFDRFMESIGLEGRRREYRVYVDVAMTVEVTGVMATTDNDAEQTVDADDVEAAVRRFTLSRDNWTVSHAEES